MKFLETNYSHIDQACVIIGMLCVLSLLILSALIIAIPNTPRRGLFLWGMTFSALLGLASVGFNRVVKRWYILPKALARSREFENSVVAKVGTIAPRLTFQTLERRSITLGPEQTRFVLLDFFATSCGPCRLGLPEYQEWIDACKMKEQIDVIVVGVEQGENELSTFRSKHRYTLEFASDEDAELYDAFFRQPRMIPRSVLLAPGGEVLAIDIKPTTFSPNASRRDPYENWLNSLIQNRPSKINGNN